MPTTDSPLISIVMPVRNAEKYLKACLDSILDQTYSNWELVAVNDHSEDSSLDILNAFAKFHANVLVLNNQGKGIIPALQLAYSNTKGLFVTRMDADDLMKPHKLELLLDRLQNSDGQLATAHVEYFAEGGVGGGYKKYADWLNKLTTDENHFEEVYKECVIPSPCWMMGKDDFEKIGGFNSNRYPEDYDFVFRCYQSQVKVVGVQQVLHLWRDHSERSSRNDENYLDNRFLDLKLDFFLAIDYNSRGELILLGAGAKAKYVARKLIENKIKFKWITNNSNKIGRDIYGQVLLDENLVHVSENSSIIGAIAGADQEELKLKFPGAYWFC